MTSHTLAWGVKRSFALKDEGITGCECISTMSNIIIICIHVSIVITIPSQALITYSSLLRSFISFLLPSNLLRLLYIKTFHFPLTQMATK